MKKLKIIKVLFLIVLVVICMYNLVFAAETSSQQTVGFQVNEIVKLSTSSNPAMLTISTATAGAQPDPVSNFLTTYAITTNALSAKITGTLDTDMPNGTTLSINLAAPSSGTSAGLKPLSTTATDLVTGITPVASPSSVITYTLAATVSAGIITSNSKTVTLTLTSN